MAWGLVKMYDGDVSQLAVTYGEEFHKWAAPHKHRAYPKAWPPPHTNITHSCLLAADLDPVAVLDFFLIITGCLESIPPVAA